MEFTFGIMTDGKNEAMVNTVVASIEAERIPNYEILVVGDSHVTGQNVRVICNTDTEAKKNGRAWITKKKNIAADEAKYENLVLMHDYFQLQPGWYEGWKKYADENKMWEIATNYIYTLEGGRHSDWVLSPYDVWYLFPELKDKWDLRVPVDDESLTRFMYISGGYWVTHTWFAREHPQMEQYGWGESEDVYWSQYVRRRTMFRFNANSSVKLLKSGKWQPGEFPLQYLQMLRRMNTWINKSNG